ncbi:MAG TPA: hypothetical protein VGP68_16990 [Gemmataceae bacterium]|jgi:hypothetical protein|nr:hypothetical protein [Gemmataceae bacterium]
MNESTAIGVPNKEDGHERSDVSAPGILLFIGGLATFIVVVTGFIWLVFGYLAAQQALIKESRFPLAVADRQRPLQDRLPPDPRLEGLNPESSIRSGVAGWPSLAPAQRERDDQALSSYGWADAEAGIAQIPIDRALDLLAGKLPVRKEQGGKP